MSIIVALLVFSFIVFVHEFGHYIFARRGGIAVEEFAIGMGPKLFSFERKGTQWSIRLLPIGGFCRMHGEDGSEPQDKQEVQENQNVKKLNGGAFYEKSVGVRISTIFGGPLFNFILALFFSFIYIGMTATFSNVVSEVPEDLPAYEAGIRPGDEIVSIDGHRILRSTEARIYINMPEGEPLDVKVRRSENGDSKTLNFTVVPHVIELDETVPPEESDNYYVIGVNYEEIQKNIFTVMKYGVLEAASWIKIVFYSLGLLITGNVSMTALSGPVAIVDEFSSGYEASLAYGIKAVVSNIAFFIVLLSSNLGVMNLLPIPALDGGRLIFLFIEGVRGKPLAPDKEGFVHFIGFALLMLLMVFVLFNDIQRLFS